jgi:hypothetical protein
MPLSAGDKFGHYEVLSLLGQGGMGEVYRARDTMLKRDVAIKVLPSAVLRDPGRIARFEREAQVLASLDHPNIGHIYGLADSADSRGLVLALIEGPTLADRIKAGPLPQDEAVVIAKQIVDALEYAHDRGRHPSRSETGERQDHSRGRGQSVGFRVGQSAGRLASTIVAGKFADPDNGTHTRGNDPGHGGVHVARASSGPSRRPAQRHFLLRRGAVRDADWNAGFRRNHNARRPGSRGQERAGLV